MMGNELRKQAVIQKMHDLTVKDLLRWHVSGSTMTPEDLLIPVTISRSDNGDFRINYLGEEWIESKFTGIMVSLVDNATLNSEKRTLENLMERLEVLGE